MTAKERPILFSAPMVRALLAGRKTQTRRLVKPKPWLPIDVGKSVAAFVDRRPLYDSVADKVVGTKDVTVHCPYGVPGDRLWVKETWRPQHEHQRTPITEIPENVDIHYAASLSEYDRKEKGPWKPSIFMRRWMSRVFVKVEEVRVQRLQDISEDDARAEGVGQHPPDAPHCGACTCRKHFEWLWDSINGAGSWDANPWAWVVTFDPSVSLNLEGARR